MTDIEYMKIIKGIQNAEMTEEERQLIEKTIEETSGLTIEQYDGLKKALDEAKESTVPFAVVKEGDIAVVGDVNNTELKKFEYKMKFTKPVYDDENNLVDIEEVEKTYKNVVVKARYNTQIVKWLASILPYFYKVDSEGNQVDYTRLELMEIFGSMRTEIIDIMYELVAVILGLSNEERDNMVGSSVFEVIVKFVKDNPQTAKESQTFFS